MTDVLLFLSMKYFSMFCIMHFSFNNIIYLRAHPLYTIYNVQNTKYLYYILINNAHTHYMSLTSFIHFRINAESNATV